MWDEILLYFCLEFAAGRATAVSAREHCKFAGSKSRICTAIRSSGSGRRITSWEKAANAKYCKVSRDTNKTNKVYTSSWKSEQPNFQEIHPSRGKRTAQWRTTACKILEHRTNRYFKNSMQIPTRKNSCCCILGILWVLLSSCLSASKTSLAAPCEVAFTTNHDHFAAGCQVNWQACLAHSRSGSQTERFMRTTCICTSISRGLILLYGFMSPCC